MMWNTTDLLEDKPQQAIAIKFTIYNAECKLIKGKLSGRKTFCKKKKRFTCYLITVYPRYQLEMFHSVQLLCNQRQSEKFRIWARKRKEASWWSEVLFSQYSKLSVSIGNQCPRVWRKVGKAQNGPV